MRGSNLIPNLIPSRSNPTPRNAELIYEFANEHEHIAPNPHRNPERAGGAVEAVVSAADRAGGARGYQLGHPGLFSAPKLISKIQHAKTRTVGQPE